MGSSTYTFTFWKWLSKGDGEEKQIKIYADREMNYHTVDVNAIREKRSLVTVAGYILKLSIL